MGARPARLQVKSKMDGGELFWLGLVVGSQLCGTAACNIMRVPVKRTMQFWDLLFWHAAKLAHTKGLFDLWKQKCVQVPMQKCTVDNDKKQHGDHNPETSQQKSFQRACTLIHRQSNGSVCVSSNSASQTNSSVEGMLDDSMIGHVAADTILITNNAVMLTIPVHVMSVL